MKVAITLLAVLVSANVLAGDLKLVAGLDLMALDGKAFDGDPLRGSEVHSLEGVHQVVFRYEASLKQGSITKLKQSTPVVAEIDFDKHSNYEITVPRMRSLSQADAYFRRNEPWKALVDGKEVTLETEKLPGQGFMPYANIEKPLAAYNLGKKNQWAPEGVTKLVATQLVDQGNNGETLATFKLLYQNATDEQKAQIKQWINAQ